MCRSKGKPVSKYDDKIIGLVRHGSMDDKENASMTIRFETSGKVTFHYKDDPEIVETLWSNATVGSEVELTKSCGRKIIGVHLSDVKAAS